MKVKITIPNHLDEITLRQYKEFNAMQGDVDSGFLTWKKQVLNLFCTGDVDKIDHFKKADIENAFDNLLEVLNSQEPRFDKIITIDGVKYGFIPNLSDLTIGEFIDLETYMKDGVWENIEKVLAVLYRPVNHESFGKYNIVDHANSLNGRDKLFLDKFPMTILHGLLVFFSIIETELLQNTKIYLKQMEKKSNFKTNQGLNGDGTKQS